MGSMFDDHAFEILYEHFSPDELDRVRDGLTPYLPLAKLLTIFLDAVKHSSPLPGDRPLPPPEERVSLAEGMTAGRLLVESVGNTVHGWMTGHLRASGASWTEVGKVLGVSKQAAHERFQRYADSIKAFPDLHQEALRMLADEDQTELDKSMAEGRHWPH